MTPATLPSAATMETVLTAHTWEQVTPARSVTAMDALKRRTNNERRRSINVS